MDLSTATLHETKHTPNGRRVRFFLAEKGLDIPGVQVDLRGGENLADSYQKKNPFGRIPLLELADGTCIAESVAICRYIEALQPSPALFGTTPVAQATVEMWNRRAELNLLMPVAMAFRNLSGFFKDREEICAEWGQISATTAANTLPLFDAHLADNQWLAGDSFSIADITLACTLDFAQAVKLPLPFDQQEDLARWRAEVAARPAAQAQ